MKTCFFFSFGEKIRTTHLERFFGMSLFRSNDPVARSQGFSNGGCAAPRGHLAMSSDSFWLSHLGGAVAY